MYYDVCTRPWQKTPQPGLHLSDQLNATCQTKAPSAPDASVHAPLVSNDEQEVNAIVQKNHAQHGIFLQLAEFVAKAPQRGEKHPEQPAERLTLTGFDQINADVAIQQDRRVFPSLRHLTAFEGVGA